MIRQSSDSHTISDSPDGERLVIKFKSGDTVSLGKDPKYQDIEVKGARGGASRFKVSLDSKISNCSIQSTGDIVGGGVLRTGTASKSQK